MSSKPLLVFDFDGVIIDGIFEYWSSSRKACLEMIGEKEDSNILPKKIPNNFKELRPWVHYGWEMVLITAELIRENSPLRTSGSKGFASNYQANCENALQEWNWTAKELQEKLDNVREQAIKSNLQGWLDSHKPFPDVINRIKELNDEGLEFIVLTTKNAEFTSQLLSEFNLHPKKLYGHESGTKVKILLQISSERIIKGFIEDRRSTLETVLNTPGLSSLPCFLAGWGYLKPSDKRNLPKGIHLLEKEKLIDPLANWY